MWLCNIHGVLLLICLSQVSTSARSYANDDREDLQRDLIDLLKRNIPSLFSNRWWRFEWDGRWTVLCRSRWSRRRGSLESTKRRRYQKYAGDWGLFQRTGCDEMATMAFTYLGTISASTSDVHQRWTCLSRCLSIDRSSFFRSVHFFNGTIRPIWPKRTNRRWRRRVL